MSLLRKVRTFIRVDKRWLLRYLRKYSKQNLSFAIAKLTGRTFWEVSAGDTTIKLSFTTPYHQAVAKEMRDGIYERTVMRAWLDVLPGKKIIYDIGGFNGLYGLIAAKRNPEAQVTIFEPDHTNAEHIRKNIEINALSNCAVIDTAVSDEDGVATFSQGGTSGEYLGSGAHEVKVVALKSLPRADLIKIDVEGAELSVLKGMEYITTALLEVHPLFVSRFNTTEKEISEYLEKEGYTVTFLEERDKAKHYLLTV